MIRGVVVPTLFLAACLFFVVSVKADEPPAALPPGYNAAAARSKEAGKAFVAWVGVRGRVIPGAVGLECQTFPYVNGAGIVVGVWRGERFERYDLPATAADAEIVSVCGGTKAGACCRNCGSSCPCGPGCACDAAEARLQAAPRTNATPPAPPVYAAPPPTYYRPPVVSGGFRLQGPFGGSVGGGVCVGGG
jgi:hypothetical protein